MLPHLYPALLQHHYPLPFNEKAQHGSGVEVDGDVLDEDGAEPSGQRLKTDLAEASVDQSVHEVLKNSRRGEMILKVFLRIRFCPLFSAAFFSLSELRLKIH